jgi:hypothetical protein
MLKHIQLFEQYRSHLKSEFLGAFPNIKDYYLSQKQMDNAGTKIAFNIWNSSDQDKGRMAELIKLGLVDTENPSAELIESLPGAEKIVCIHGHKVDLNEEEVKIVNEMCPGLMTGFFNQERGHYESYLDRDMIDPFRNMHSITKPNGLGVDIEKSKTYNGYPLIVVRDMGWIIWFDVDNFDKIIPTH